MSLSKVGEVSCRRGAWNGKRESHSTVNDQVSLSFHSSPTPYMASVPLSSPDTLSRLTGQLTTAPFGYLILIRAVHACICGAPFDLESTPDFAKRIEDADLPWPPLSPIDWPLKDW